MAATPAEVQTFAHVGALDLPALISNMFAAQVATAMDISTDGRRAVVLTYGNLLEWNHDLSKPIVRGSMKNRRRLHARHAPRLMQAEAIAYLPKGDGILFTTELTRPIAPRRSIGKSACAARHRLDVQASVRQTLENWSGSPNRPDREVRRTNEIKGIARVKFFPGKVEEWKRLIGRRWRSSAPRTPARSV